MSFDDSVINYAQADSRLFDELTSVVDALVRETGIDPGQILVVGAGCRDIMHSALGHPFTLRGTSDTDLGIAVADWTMTKSIERSFPRTGHTGIRYIIEGMPVDIMPFGEIEDPAGISTPEPRGSEIVVFGFNDVYQNAGRLLLPTGTQIRIPSVPGYAALKLRSWIDRSPSGEDKDAKDLAIVTFWYRESQSILNRLYGTAQGIEVLESVGLDVPLAAAQLLGADAASQLSPAGRADLIARWVETPQELLARHFTLPPGASGDFGPERRQEIVAHLSLGIANSGS
ncbi:hypothetical protein ACFSWE_15945 [Leucobacter albus]|uniref:Nucleotidyltransferase n=1 Tax=Leucobacter albus TaxID=272210 RepID=A0ABW3TL64_9MICO